MCDRASGALVDGALPGVPPGEGETVLARDAYSQSFAVGTGANRVRLAVVFDCDRGGVAWPENIGFYDPDLNLLGSVDLGDHSEYEHAHVQAMVFVGGKLRTTWTAYDGAGFTDDPNCPAYWYTTDFSLTATGALNTASVSDRSCPIGD
jgi:hypothetical protein